MTEQEWLDCTDLTAMLAFLREKASDRKLRLFGIACCHRIKYMLVDERSWAATECAERFAEGMASQTERREAYRTVHSYAGDFAPDEAAAATVHRLPFIAASEAAHWAAIAVGAAADAASSDIDHIRVGHQERDREIVRQIGLLREIIGNPLRPVLLDPTWRTSTVIALARGIHAESAFDRLPILSDALQDAGCENADILSHCRSDGPHVRGCWVIDLLLGKE